MSQSESTTLAGEESKEVHRNNVNEHDSLSSSPDHPGAVHRPFSGDFTEETEGRVTELARTFSYTSAHPQADLALRNPFVAHDDPILDPKSEKFDAHAWAKALLQIVSRDPERYPTRTAGVSYKDLNVHGFASPLDYQKNVLNVLARGPAIAGKLLGRGQQKVEILRGLDGVVKSGEMLVVLGRPGSGVSTLLKTISGQSYGLYLDQNSEFNYQGISREMMHENFRGEAVYQAEMDVHFPQLTVGQTLMFAALARTPRNRPVGVSRKQYAETLRDVVMAVFGLSHTVDTRVGNDYIRGVSGGERKRVSIAEVTLSQSPLQCWDNATRGLDSATALEFVRTLRLSAQIIGTTAVVAIYQASQDAYDTFDKVALLYEGRQIYFGHKDNAKQYFEDLGYLCPDRQTTADFLTSLTNPAERVVRPGFEDKVPRTPEEFANVWKNSEARKLVLAEIETFNKDYPIGGPNLEEFVRSRKAQQTALSRPQSPYTISTPMQISLCISRGFQRMRGDMSFPLVTIAGNLVVALVLGSTFYQMDDTTANMNNRCVLLFFAILFNALNSSLEILALYSQRPIVEKHATYALYHPFSEAISSMICDLPTKVISTCAFNIPLYFMANLRKDSAKYFFIFLFFGFVTTITMSMIFRSIGQSSKTLPQALTPAALFVLGLVIYTGFVIPTRAMHGWLRWINYIDPIAYAYESIVTNEFHNRDFPCAQFVPAYPNASPTERTCSVSGAAPGANFVSGDVYIKGNYGYSHSHLWRNLGILAAFIVFFVVVYLLIAEYVVFGKSKGEVLVFRGAKSIKAAATRDVESAGSTLVGRDDKIGNEGPNEQGNEARIQRQTAIFHWRNVCYEVKIKSNTRKILNNVDGWVKPGTLTALMGASGAGKTTLLDVLASRVTMGVVTGDIFVNGLRRDNSFQRKTGYVQQQDLHLTTSTVREALRFSATLRQPKSVSLREKYDYVEEIIALLEMEVYADAVVGVIGEGLNVEQRKRLSIGVELVAKPELLVFLDEPTSGLDSQTAWSVCSLIRKLSNNGQAILCTIHQPSAMLFQQFDRLLLLARGGKTVYFGDIGENSKTLTGYFERYGSEHCDAAENPAEWMLRVIGAAPGAHAARDWAETWRESPEYAAVQQELDRLEQSPSGEAADPHLAESYAMPIRDQLMVCTMRVFEQYWRTPSYIYSKLILCGGISLFIGLSFMNAPVTITGLQNQMFSIFMLLVIIAFLVYQTMPNFVIQRDLYEVRERPSKTYAWYAFMVSNIIVELPWNTLAALFIYFLYYYPVGMYRNAIPTDTVNERGFLMFLMILCFMIFTCTFADMVIAGVQTAEVGAVIALVMFVFCLVFCGVLQTPQNLPGFWIFMYRVSPFTYLVGGLMAAGLAGNKVHCSSIEVSSFQPPANNTCGQYLQQYIELAGGTILNPEATSNCEFCTLSETTTFLKSVSVEYGDRWRDFGLMWVYIIFNVGAALALYWLVRVPKGRKK